eukprot:9494388-Pyramimonas_sp.AAC.1
MQRRKRRGRGNEEGVNGYPLPRDVGEAIALLGAIPNCPAHAIPPPPPFLLLLLIILPSLLFLSSSSSSFLSSSLSMGHIHQCPNSRKKPHSELDFC